VPRTRSDEEWAIHILEQAGVLWHPGTLFDFPSEGFLVGSLLPPDAVFRDGVRRTLALAVGS
jgi:aspartate/methionine/tyrosine aminotransferase